MGDPILVINPNSSDSVTRVIDRAAEPLRLPGGPEFQSLTLAEGPPAVESQRDADQVIEPLCRLVRRYESEAAAFVISCFSDPGLFAARETTQKPVLGAAECAILTALTFGHRFGVLSILAKSMPRHLRYYGAMGVESRLAGEIPVGLGVLELADEERTMARLIEVGRQLRDERGADVLILGCTGMALYRERLAAAVGLPVIEPTQAALVMAIGRVRLGWG